MPRRSCVEFCPIQLLFKAVECIIVNSTFAPQLGQNSPLLRNRFHAQSVVLGFAAR